MSIDPANAVVSTEKLTGYLLSRSHPIGRYKSPFFLGLGYAAENPDRLRADLIALLQKSAEPGEVTEFGQKFLSRGALTGPNGKVGRILAVWIILAGSSQFRLVTAYLEE
jgi:hypothetical protein